MREIKFRIWGKLPYGKNEEIMTYVPHWEVFDESDLVFRTDDETFWIDSSNSKKEGIILMQYIGLKDANGKDIYEGDILGLADTSDKSKCIVEYKEAAFKRKFSLDGQVFYSWLEAWDNSWIVIGNIYENPKLADETLSR